jgi:hypothetical protein
VLTLIQYYIIIKIKKTKTSRKDLKKEGIMRINSYNKFFAKVAEIMNTTVKAVKQLDGRYKVELANHVYLNVYRGVGGSMFVHDHRGISHITSCYDFEDFKTMKNLYERLVSDYSEYTKKDVMEVKQELNSRFGKEINETLEQKQQKYQHLTSLFWSFPTVEEMRNNKCFCCPADRQGNRCCGKECCNKTWTRYDAITKPEWHHVSLATLANIDIDMLDEKRQRYFKIHKELIKTLNDLHKCKTAATYETRWCRFRQTIADDIYYRGTIYMTRFLDSKISMCNVECGLWSSVDEKATNFIKSRRYSHAILK